MFPHCGRFLFSSYNPFVMAKSERETGSQAGVSEKLRKENIFRAWWDTMVYRFAILGYQVKDLWEYRNKPLSPNSYAMGSGSMYDYAERPKTVGFQENYFQMPLIQEFLNCLAEIPNGQRILDLGSGIGAESESLQKLFPHLFVASLDFSTAGTLEGKKRGLNQVQGKAQQLPFPDESFCAVHSKDLLVHIKNKKQLFAEVARVVQPRGYFCLVSADAMPMHISTQYKWRAKDLLKHAYQNGFEMVSYDDQPLKIEDWYKSINIPRFFILFQKTNS